MVYVFYEEGGVMELIIGKFLLLFLMCWAVVLMLFVGTGKAHIDTKNNVLDRVAYCSILVSMLSFMMTAYLKL